MRFSFPAVGRWQPSRSILLGAALLLQVVLIMRAFGALLLEPGRHLLVDTYDGAKNYFTFLAYVQQPWENGLRWFGLMNYPYGDYVFYTDNTPLLAVAVRLWSHYIFDLRPHALDVYHGFMLAAILLSTALLVLILQRLLRHWGLVVVFAVVLPWLNPQVSRLLVGHFNLSFSFVLLLGIWGLQGFYDRVQAGRPYGRWVAGLIGAFSLIGLVHLYYLPLLAFMVAGFLACWLLPDGRWRNLRLTGAGALLTLAPFGIVYIIIRLADGYYAQRGHASGFNYQPWNMQFSALFNTYPYETVHFWLQPRDQPSYEAVGYLGAFALFGLTVFLVVWLVRPAAGRWFRQQWHGYPHRRFLWLLLGAGIIGLAASLGTSYELFDGAYRLTNYLNVFYYLEKITQAVSHFRVMARFSWLFFWAVNLLVLVGLDVWLHRGRGVVRWVVVVALVVLALLDTRDTLKFYRHSLHPNTMTDSYQTPEVNALLANIRPEEYQAILPVPFFHVGTENIDLTVDDDNSHSMHCYQLVLRTNLPLMASKMSRTPPRHVEELRTIFEGDGLSPELRQKLQAGGKPVLVLLDQSYYDGTNRYNEQQQNPKARQLIEAGADLPTRLQLTPVAEAGKLRLYRWDVR